MFRNRTSTRVYLNACKYKVVTVRRSSLIANPELRSATTATLATEREGFAPQIVIVSRFSKKITALPWHGGSTVNRRNVARPSISSILGQPFRSKDRLL